jgi:DNA (cytosine-5)-methyltransferase 1
MKLAPVQHNITGLFAGVAGLEAGLGRAGHTTSLFCECDPEAVSVLRARFSTVPVHLDVRKTDELKEQIDPSSSLLTAGFPCTDLSQAGTTRGFAGGRSSLILDTLKLIAARPFENILLENVPNWRQLHKGAYLRQVVEALEKLGYRWAYRTIDARAFGVPQRRLRIILFATLTGDPREVLFHGDERERELVVPLTQAAHGFYWTEGNTGLGWGEDCIPTLKGGSALAIPSAPAILMPDLSIITPRIEDAERLQGFSKAWTDLEERAEMVGGGRFHQRRRWLLVGNAVSVQVSEWVGDRLAGRQSFDGDDGQPMEPGDSWPTAAWFDGEVRRKASVGTWPVKRSNSPLAGFLSKPGQPLSLRATDGFYRRISTSRLRLRAGFLDAVKAHADRMRAAVRHELGNEEIRKAA